MRIQFDLRICFRWIQITNYCSSFSRFGKETAVDGGVLETFEHAKTVFLYISKLTCLRYVGWKCFVFEIVLKGAVNYSASYVAHVGFAGPRVLSQARSLNILFGRPISQFECVIDSLRGHSGSTHTVGGLSLKVISRATC